MHRHIKKILKAIRADRVYKNIRIKIIKSEHEQKDFRLNKNIRWMGNACGFFVDTSLLKNNSVLLSFGAGIDISFELDMHKKIKHTYIFDPTPVSKNFISKILLPQNMHFFETGLSAKDETADFYLPKDSIKVSASAFKLAHVSEQNKISVHMQKLSTVMKQLKLQSFDILKMDIEGSEFDVIKNMMEEKIYPRQICVEFHSRYFTDGIEKLNSCINLLLENNYTFSAKNSGEEYLFIHSS